MKWVEGKKLSKEFVKKVTDLHKKLARASSTRNKKLFSNTLEPWMIQKLASPNIPAFLGCASAKVLHSASAGGWLNVVLYHSPSDRALLSFQKEFHGSQWVFKNLVENVRRAAREEKMWSPFSSIVSAIWKEYHEKFDAVIDNKNMNPQYQLPDAQNKIRPFTLCPYASPNCRAVCLNTSGQGGMTRTGSFEKQQFWAQYKKLAATGLREGYTFSSDMEYFYLKGMQAFYGGTTNTVQAARIRRTHLMWLCWAVEGVMQNTYNDVLYYEALEFLRGARQLGVPMALRLNGTSDLPVHTLRLHKAVDEKGKSLAGKNLLIELGKRGIVSYDYTKDFPKMRSWMSANTWRGADRALSGNVSMSKGWPTNYYLCFSWSEVNGINALKVLQGGGNVVMVFRRSVEARGKVVLTKKPLEEGKKAHGAFPNQIRVAQLSRTPVDSEWIATIVDGDRTDLRFDDAVHQVGVARGGVIVGLVAKGGGKASYTDGLRRNAWEHFVNPVVLKKLGETIEADVRPNPAAPEKAVEGVDADLIRQATATVDGWQITTTAMGT